MTDIGIITVRDRRYHPNRRLIEAGEQSGLAVRLVHPYRIWPAWMDGKPVLIGEKAKDVPRVILPRQGSEIGEACLTLIRHFVLSGIPVVNRPEAIARSRNQFITLQALGAAGIPFPDTILINDADGFFESVHKLGGYPVVVKPVRGRQGSGVTLVHDPVEAQERVRPVLDRYFGLLVQQYIAPDKRTDIRVLVIGGEIAGAMELHLPQGDFRTNFHLTGRGHPACLSSDQRRTVLRAVDAVGLDIAGVDLMESRTRGTLIVEVNDSPGFQGLEAVTGVDAAAIIIAHAQARCRE